ncbi:MAG: anti-sigma factor domain-containing protein [Acidimicrobiales bacterium]
MVRTLTHNEAAELLGPLALDAIEADERLEVEDHVASCGACQLELSDHREVAAMLTTGWIPAPEGLWDRIASSLEEAPPPLDLATVTALRPARAGTMGVPDRRSDGGHRWSRLWRGPAAAAAVAASVVMGALGGGMLVEGRNLGDLAARLGDSDLEQAANAAQVDPQARKVTMRSPDGLVFAEAVMTGDGTGFLVKDNLPTLGPDRTYQLWAVVDGQTISVGVLGSAPDRVAFRAAAPIDALAISEEKAGGVERSAGAPVAVGLLAA